MTNLNLSEAGLERYSRHLIMEDVGAEGQQALLDGSVLVVGAGGLGSPIIQYLAAAGVGTLGIIDDDIVERSNLNRQVIHGESDLDRPKVDSAAAFVTELNPDVTVETYNRRFAPSDAMALVDAYDLVVDASDNLQTRYLINDTCTLAGVPYTHGAVYQFEGQVTSFSGDGPCYRCLFPSAPPEDAVPDCATAGVFGVVPGTIGSIEATEALKFLLDRGESLTGRLVYYDALGMTFDTIPIEPTPDCPVCGTEPAIDAITDVRYADDCAIPSTSE